MSTTKRRYELREEMKEIREQKSREEKKRKEKKKEEKKGEEN